MKRGEPSTVDVAMVMIVDEFEELFKKIANAIFPLKSDQLTLLNNFSALRGI